MTEAHAEEQEFFWENIQYLFAWHAANVMNASGNLKRPVSVEKLLGKKKAKKQQKNKEEQRKELERLKKEFGFK
jgi:hypothetical protein